MLTVSTEVPAPFATEAGLKAHVGTRLTTGATLHVKATALLKLVPGAGAMVTVEVEDAPAATVAGTGGYRFGVWRPLAQLLLWNSCTTA